MPGNLLSIAALLQAETDTMTLFWSVWSQERVEEIPKKNIGVYDHLKKKIVIYIRYYALRKSRMRSACKATRKQFWGGLSGRVAHCTVLILILHISYSSTNQSYEYSIDNPRGFKPFLLARTAQNTQIVAIRILEERYSKLNSLFLFCPVLAC